MGLFLCTTLLAVHKAHSSELDIAILKAAKKYNIDAHLMRAIATVETNMGTTALLRHNQNGTIDVGVFQINSVNFKTCKHLDVLTVRGNAECAGLLLAQHKHSYKGTLPYWTAYHSKTPSKARFYEAQVRRALFKGRPEYTLYKSK